MSQLEGQTVEAWRNRIEVIRKAMDETTSESSKENFRNRIEIIQKWIEKSENK